MDITQGLADIGEAGATTLVVAMATDGWESLRARLGRWFATWSGGGEDEAGHRLERMDRDREHLLAASPGEEESRAGRLVADWTVRLRDIADTHHEAAAELRDLARQWREEHPTAPRHHGDVSRWATASGGSRVVQVGGDWTVQPGRRGPEHR
ncbi:hypothetical protein [Streptomyces sp. ST2-7A]|uniref:hypothetical protein n=1 Tax=Streptomyces sp. ST2-7A TaxID=2907214 RepID=UPI001F264006|nr:hypothetical protein [Streptomyces sp. ST2-7A]MCE7081823.1 hypothetical protein [Streptomyces sp. ST2-7A]